MILKLVKLLCFLGLHRYVYKRQGLDMNKTERITTRLSTNGRNTTLKAKGYDYTKLKADG